MGIFDLLGGKDKVDTFTSRPIDPQEYGVDLERDTPIDVLESRVFLTDGRQDGKRKVLKIFDTDIAGDVTLKTLIAYQQLSEKVGAAINGQEVVLEVNRRNLRIKWFVNPIERAGLLQGTVGVPTSVSDYIPGLNLGDLLDRGDPPFFGEKHEVGQALWTTSEDLRKRFRNKAIFFSETNTKFLEHRGEPSFVITDICANVGALTRKGQH